jgi:hypothetical protein
MPRSSISPDKFAEIDSYSGMMAFYKIITGHEDQSFNGIVKIINLQENKIIDVVNPKFAGPVNWARRLPYVKIKDDAGKRYIISVPEKNKVGLHLFFYQKNTKIQGGITMKRTPRKMNKTMSNRKTT